ncbi:hypothetical protein N0V90_001006 [Kalmusia sp. IMI 367209]|nr:hypothetical protein N0V90_001006 [Kalmusia sp. IMI 367209]
MSPASSHSDTSPRGKDSSKVFTVNKSVQQLNTASEYIASTNLRYSADKEKADLLPVHNPSKLIQDIIITPPDAPPEPDWQGLRTTYIKSYSAAFIRQYDSDNSVVSELGSSTDDYDRCDCDQCSQAKGQPHDDYSPEDDTVVEAYGDLQDRNDHTSRRVFVSLNGEEAPGRLVRYPYRRATLVSDLMFSLITGTEDFDMPRKPTEYHFPVIPPLTLEPSVSTRLVSSNRENDGGTVSSIPNATRKQTTLATGDLNSWVSEAKKNNRTPSWIFEALKDHQEEALLRKIIERIRRRYRKVGTVGEADKPKKADKGTNANSRKSAIGRVNKRYEGTSGALSVLSLFPERGEEEDESRSTVDSKELDSVTEWGKDENESDSREGDAEGNNRPAHPASIDAARSSNYRKPYVEDMKEAYDQTGQIYDNPD